MSFILVLLIISLVVIVPVKFAATYVQAGRTGVGSCLIAVIVAGGFQTIVGSLFDNQFLSFIAALAIAPLAYMFVLDTTYKKGLVIGAIQVTLTIALFLVLLPSMSQYGTVTIDLGK